MDGERWQRVKEIFGAALEREGEARRAYLAQACDNDALLREEVDSLIAAHETTEDFIERPAAQVALGIGAEQAPASWIDRRVGDYRIVEEVGRGGMSEVYRAIRDDDEYQKEVAVKVLRRGYDTHALLRRFKVETQILATLDHPNIARLLDAGSTEEGLPYLVMDYIHGQPIDEYCREHHPPLRARLDLFRALCGAVQYVHQHLMVHGDLKCSNVLVAANGAVKLLDFGIARLLNTTAAPGVGAPDAKLTSFLALTPEYASPEQIRGGPITTASDVYSLGVMLYHLLTGVLPYRLSGDFSYELAAQIVEREALAPSIAATNQASAETTGFGRHLRGDLDNIVLMALEKDPVRRYSSVERLEEDIRRHLEGFPVAARSAGFFYQLGKFAGRHKAAIAAVSLIGLTLVGGIFATLRQAHIAFQERQRAERHFDEVRKLANVFMFDVHGAIQDLPGSTPARRMLVENSLRYLEMLSAESADEPTLQLEVASAYEKLADVQGGFRLANLGDTAGAISSYRKALDIREALAVARPEDRDLRRDLLRNHGKLSDLLAGDGQLGASIVSARRAAKLAQELVTLPGATLADRRNMATALLSLGWQLARTPQVGDGVLLIRQATAMFETLLEQTPDDPAIERNLALAYDRLGETLQFNTSDYSGALAAHRKSLEIAQKMLRADPHSNRLQKIVAYAHLGTGAALHRLGQSREALAEQLRGLELLHGMLDADARNEMARFDAAFAIGEVSDSLLALGDFGTAERQLTEALNILSQAAGIADPALNEFKVQLGLDYFRLGRAHAQRAGLAAITRAERIEACEQARRWFGLGEPIVSAAGASADAQWKVQSEDAMEQMKREANDCSRHMPVAALQEAVSP